MFTKWLKRRQQQGSQDRSACDTDSRSDNKNPEGHLANNNGGQAVMINRGELFPARLALALGMAKTLLGVLLVAFGALALWEQASMAYLGSGLWTGAVVLVSGFMGIMAGLKRTNLVYIVSYLLMSVLSLAAIGLLLIFAATGLARDSDAPHGYFVDQEEGSRVDILGTVPLRQRPIIVNAVLVALGTLSTIFSLAATVICLREACLCYRMNPSGSSIQQHRHRRLINSNSSSNSSAHQHAIHKVHRPNMNLLTADQSPEGQARAYRLLRWLRQSHQHQNNGGHQQQQPLAPLLRRIYTPTPMMHPVPVHPVHPVPMASGGPFPSFVTGAPTAYVIPAPPAAVLMTPAPGFGPFYSLTSLPSLHHHHNHQSLQHFHQYQHQMAKDAERIRRGERRRSKSGGKNRSDSDKRHHRPEEEDDDDEQLHQEPENNTKEIPAAKKEISNNKPAIVSDGETSSIMSGFIFTGMDREMAEEFVSMTRNQQLNSLDSSVVRNSPLNP